jgi:four helix bundle protein
MHWKDLEVWQKAHSLVLEIYKLSAGFPGEERFRLTDQLCRAVVSVPANIVEGSARHSTKEYMQFLSTARGSLEETRYYLLLSRDLGYGKVEKYEQLESTSESISRMLNALLIALRKRLK